MNALTAWTSALAQMLLVPAVALLVGLVAWSIFQVGALLGAWRMRRRLRDEAKGDRSVDPLEGLRFGESHAWAMTAELAALRWVVRTAPMLGLMGTLIPMGPALERLAEGDVAAASAHIALAFGTTVLGLAASAMAYTVWQVRKLWYARDLSEWEAQNEDEEGRDTTAEPPNHTPAPTGCSTLG